MTLGAPDAADVAVIARAEHGMRSAEWKWRCAVYAVTTLVAIAWSFLAGKDLNWDALNYHLYAGFSAVHDRFGVDYFPAGPQSYFSPYGYVPFYAMVMAGWPSLVIGTLFAAVHSINLWMTYELALRVTPRRAGRPAQGVALVALALALLNPVLLQTIGSSYVDVTTSAIALGGWVVLASMFHRESQWGVVFAGALLGIATALKLSNAVFAIAGVVILLCLRAEGGTKPRVRRVATYCAACALAFAAVYGPWAFKLQHALQNPFFPFFNGVFRSPDFTTEPLHQMRFVPQSLGAALWRPVEMSYPIPMVHVEPQSPDVRYVELGVVLILFAAAALRRHFGRGATAAGASEASAPDVSASHRALVALTAGFLVAWMLWLFLSGNSRYFLPMGCVLGALVAAMTWRLLGSRPTAFALFAAVLVLPQAWLIVTATWTRYGKLDWNGPWFGVSMAERFQRHPFLFLGVDANPSSFLLPFLAEGSAMMSISGLHALTPVSPGGARAEALLANYQGRVRIVDWVGQIRSDGTPLPASAEAYNGQLRPFGLQVDRFDCAYILVHGGPSPRVVQIEAGAPMRALPPSYLLTCGVIASSDDLVAYWEHVRAADQVFNRIEDACPRLFSPKRMPTQEFSGSWRRAYVNSEVLAWITAGRVRYRTSATASDLIDIGSVAEWSAGTPAVDCTRRDFKPRDGNGAKAN